MVPAMRPVMKSGDVKSMLKLSTLNLIDSTPLAAACFSAARNTDDETSAHSSLVSTD